MTRAIAISSAEDPQLAEYAGLRDRDLRRAEEGVFVGEQRLIVERMLAVPGLTRSVLCTERQRSAIEPLVPDGVALFVAPDGVVAKVAGFHVHRGVLAIGLRARVPSPTLAALAGDAGRPRLLLGCEDITHADNMGALFRVAAAFGCDGVLLSPRCHDPLYRRCIRMSIGHVLSIPWRRADDWPGELNALRGAFGIRCLGASLDPAAMPHAQAAPEPRALLLVGGEYGGLTPDAVAACDALLRIPMAPGVDSLNVAVAAGILLDRVREPARR